MFRHLRSPSTWLSLIALVFALGGTAFAATLITGKQVKNSSLTGADVKNSSLTGADVKNGSLTKSDIKGGIPAGKTGSAGSPGAPGAPGAPGSKGDRGPSDAFHAFSNTIVTSPSATTGYFTVLTLPALPPGSYAITGSVSVENDNAATQMAICRITVGTRTASARIGLGLNADSNDFGSGTVQIATTLAAPTPVTMECTNPGGAVSDTDVYDRQITAIQVGNLTGGQPQA